MNQTRALLQDLIDQNKLTCSFALDRVTQENSSWRLNPKTASVGFIFRHIGETMNLFGYFFGYPPPTANTTMGREDNGEYYDLSESKALVDMGFNLFENLVKTQSDEEWSEMIDTPFFGQVSKMRLFSHVLFHNAHHAGQISLSLSRGA
jgi:uncharacterized damage-inducible protein DinB